MSTTISFPPFLIPTKFLSARHIHSSSKSLPPKLTINCSKSKRSAPPAAIDDDDGVPIDDVKILTKFKSKHNYIRVLEVSRRSDHPFAGSRLLLLDNPGNIHSISFQFKLLTETYFDVFATLPAIIPPGPIAILGFGAGTAARLLLNLYPEAIIHGWELDPSVVAVARDFFGLSELENRFADRLFVHIGDAFEAEIQDGFAGILLDLFAEGSLANELQDEVTWKKLKTRLRNGGRMMVNCGGKCVEAEDCRRDGEVMMGETLKAMNKGIADEVFVLKLGKRTEDSCLAITGPLPEKKVWTAALPEKSLKKYVSMWEAYNG